MQCMHVTHEDKNIFEEPKKYYNGKWKQTQLFTSEYLLQNSINKSSEYP